MGYGQHSEHGHDTTRRRTPASNRTRGVITSFRDYEECARAWARQGQDYGKSHGERMYFRGAVIYSYGSHFPMARIVEGGAVLMNGGQYSVTTSRHLSAVRRAIHGRNTFYVPTSALEAYDQRDAKGGFDRAIANYLGLAVSDFEKSLTARSRKQEYIDAAMHHLSEANRFATFYAMPIPFMNTSDLQAARLTASLDNDHKLATAISAVIGKMKAARKGAP